MPFLEDIKIQVLESKYYIPFEPLKCSSGVEVILKSGKEKDRLIKNLTTSDITRRIKYIQLHEILQKIV